MRKNVVNMRGCHPSSINYINNLSDSIKKLSNSKKSKYIILAGDFNCPDIDWENLVVKQGAADRNTTSFSGSFNRTWTHPNTQ